MSKQDMATTRDNLNDLMQFDHVIHIDDAGNVTEPRDVYAPELHALSDEDGSHTADTDPELQREAKAQGWELEAGWTGQYSYSGPCMHQSEYVGGAIADYILETPGYWVTVIVYEDDGEAESWALAHRSDLMTDRSQPRKVLP